MQKYRYYDLIMAFFVAVLITSNIASSAKVVDLGITIFDFWYIPPVHLAFDGGTLFFPLAYVLGDILTEVYGYKAARRVIWTGFIVLSLSSLFFFVLSRLPGDSVWESYAGTAAYNSILGGISSGGIVAASLSGYLIGSFSNSAMLSWMKAYTKGRFLWLRVVGSSLVGELLDSLVFMFVACVTGVFEWELFTSLALTNYFLKITIEVIVIPFTFLGVKKLNKAEKGATFDPGILSCPGDRTE